MANGTILVTVEQGENKRGKDADGNTVATPYRTARLGMTGSRAYVNVSAARLDILKAAGLDSKTVARLTKAVESADKWTAENAPKSSKSSAPKSSVETF